MLRFFDLDHIDPEYKVDCVSRMIKENYTLEDLIEECKKCRTLCGDCHRVHTRNQLKAGLIKRGDKVLNACEASDSIESEDE